MEFFNCSSGCNPFSEANASTDTVKVILPPQNDDKENAFPIQRPNQDSKKLLNNQIAAEKEEQERLRKKAKRERAEKQAAEEAQRLEAELAAAEEKALAAEIKRQEEAELARAAAEEAAERRREEERLQAQLKAREEKEQAERDERERQEAQARREKEEVERAAAQAAQKATEREKVKQFLVDHEYLGVNSKRTKMMKTKYPLHTAVKLGDQEMVLLLLSCEANPNLKNSAGQTPKQLAIKLNKNGSHDGIIGVLPEPCIS